MTLNEEDVEKSIYDLKNNSFVYKFFSYKTGGYKKFLGHSILI